MPTVTQKSRNPTLNLAWSDYVAEAKKAARAKKSEPEQVETPTQPRAKGGKQRSKK